MGTTGCMQLVASINGKVLTASDPRALLWTNSGCTTTTTHYIENINFLNVMDGMPTVEGVKHPVIQMFDTPIVGLVASSSKAATKFGLLSISVSANGVGQALFGAPRLQPTTNWAHDGLVVTTNLANYCGEVTNAVGWEMLCPN